MNIPAEPLLTLNGTLDYKLNEQQDLAVVLHKLCTQPTATCKLVDIVPSPLIPDSLVVKLPSNPSWTRESRHIESPDELLPLVQLYQCSAFINGPQAAFSDSFLILELLNPFEGYTHVALLLQSKRKESFKGRQEIDSELFWDFEKTLFRHRNTYQVSHILPVYVYITDAKRFGTGIVIITI